MHIFVAIRISRRVFEDQELKKYQRKGTEELINAKRIVGSNKKWPYRIIYIARLYDTLVSSTNS